MQRGAWENDIGHMSRCLVWSFGSQQMRPASVEDPMWLFAIEDRGSHAVNESVAGIQDAVIDHEPTVGYFDWNGSCSDFGPLPPEPMFVTPAPHDEPVPAPMAEVGAAAQIDIAEWGMAIVTGPAQHEIVAIDLSRKENPIAIEWEERVFHSSVTLEILGLRHGDGGSEMAAAPSDVVRIINPANTWIVRIIVSRQIEIRIREMNRVPFDFPCQTVLASANMQMREPGLGLKAENSDEGITERGDGAVINPLNSRKMPSADDRICRMAPYHLLAIRGAILPWNRIVGMEA